jgi:lipoprotein-anchoring transpeptidase ErfK/SrfK
VRSRRQFLGSTLVTGAALLTACTSEESGSPTRGTNAPAAKIAFAPKDGATEVAPTEPVKITVEGGELTEATVTNPEGQPVAGQLAEDKKSWTSGEVLGYGKTYNYTAKAKNTDGKETAQSGSFATLAPAATPRATINPGDNATVGVAMPISIKFPEGAPEDQAAVEKALSVETSQPVEGSWAWISSTQVDWRPKDYWPANTQVTVNAKLYGVAYGGGAYGKADLATAFTIGRNQVVKINTPDHVMNVYRDGQLAASYPSSNGKDADPNLNTPNGTVIVMAKEEVGDFSNPQYGYTNVLKKWAVRISNHGEFIHENEENHANIGKVNSSHGCVNLFEPDAKAYFDSAMIGDPVEITGSQANFPTSSDVFDWLISWDQWKSMSALS